MPGEMLLINPRRKRRSRRRMSAKQRMYFGGGRRRRHSRRRAAVTVVAANPRRRHRRRASYHVRRLRRNPSRSLSLGSSGMKTQLMAGATGAVGAIGLNYVLSYLNPMLPASLQSGIGNTAVQVAGAIGVGYAVGKVAGRSAGNAAAVGGLVIVFYNFISGFMGGTNTTTGRYVPMAGYIPMGATPPNMVRIRNRQRGRLGYTGSAPTLRTGGVRITRTIGPL